ncbi:hypothetical protein [Pseudalkalibacillus caeni]|uniref:Uncharacterized protein n=1 Tax=Exobacillus caeni TaxID=2574798 RepID=A0A5R9F5A8_9BACL|nr:hypothetical protein [Pseudalkalibacillus caeni]TLS38922.1 hypothetical protein FCL54_01010 [Pseudalkalibacillus caeni]
MDENTFKVTKEIEKLNDQYTNLAQQEASEKTDDAYSKISEDLTRLRSMLLQTDEYSSGHEVNRETTMATLSGDLPSYQKVTVIYEYDNGKALVEDTDGIKHLVDQESLK